MVPRNGTFVFHMYGLLYTLHEAILNHSTHDRSITYHTQLANMSFDQILHLMTAVDFLI